MSHGYHWYAIHEDEERAMAEINRALKEGGMPGLQPPQEEGAPYWYATGAGYPLVSAIILKEEESEHEIVSAFPCALNLIGHELEVYSIDPVEDEELKDVEGIVTAITSDGTMIPFFCLAWLAVRHDLEHGGRFIFGLGAIAYCVEKAPQEISFTKGALFEREKKRRMDEDPNFDPATFTSVSVHTGSLRIYHAQEGSDFEFQSVVEEVTPFSCLGTSGVVLRINLAPEGMQPIVVQLCATTKALEGYVPAVGDSISGVAWMQGMPIEPVAAEDSWLDSAKAAYGDGTQSLLAMAPLHSRIRISRLRYRL